jgi:hypothetical protein
MEDDRKWVNIFCQQGICTRSKDSLYSFLLKNKQIGNNKNHFKTADDYINIRFMTHKEAQMFTHPENWTVALQKCQFKNNELSNIRVSYRKSQHDSSDKSSAHVVKKRKTLTKSKEEDTSNGMTAKRKSCALSKTIIECDDEINNPMVSSVPSGSASGKDELPIEKDDTPVDSDKKIPVVKKKSRPVIESDDD